MTISLELGLGVLVLALIGLALVISLAALNVTLRTIANEMSKRPNLPMRFPQDPLTQK
jgi:hypothetical protein